ncbi:Serine/threonine protein kinase [Actinacidiphila rubida]|uniref:non-specific serine/threonine protein kinase n=2 Tax=Actinacidiphila rubida TaxID=310780 RepID=A0A1H8MKH1_9ACTN|nr:serine/threonine-protein kinase [Actinacidiphila rubida]SEO17784.1 Serine/threonine protein kinase [Actinacidiphila rubida]
MTDAERTDGRLLAGRYRLGGMLGKGGMGTVWRAVDETLGRTVAVKELRFPGNVDEDEKRRLVTRTLREAKATARIRNTGAITVFDVVKEDDRPWIVMELVEGRSLADVIREDGPLTPRRAAEVGLVLLDVLKAAHAEGILHRDVKPSNVLIADGGSAAGTDTGGDRVVLSDFGIAQIDGDPSVTSTGMLVGAPSYISPERARGQKPGPPADLWSLGALLYAAVEGRPPYDKGSAIATLTAVMTEPVGPMTKAGPLADAIRGLLVKDPAQRLDDAGARALLTAVAAMPDRPAAPPAGGDSARTTVMERPATAAEGAAAGAAAAGAAPVSDGRTSALPQDAAPAAAAAGAGDQARMRAALRSVRKAAKPKPAPEPGTPATTRRPAPSSLSDVVPRRAMLIAAVVVAIALIGTVIGIVAANSGGGKGGSGDTKNGSTGGASTTPATTAPATGGGQDKNGKGKGKGNGKGDDQGDQTDAGKTPASGQPSAGAPSPGTAPGAVPAGWHVVTIASAHYSLALPPGWKQLKTVEAGAGAVFGIPGHTFPQVLVDFTPTPGKDAAAQWRTNEPGVGSHTPGYQFLSIKPVSYRNYPTAADWEFTRSGDGSRVHVRNRGFVVDRTHGYAIMVSLPVDQWNGAGGAAILSGFYSSFKPTA